MSDLVSRLAARSVGQPTSARPRVASRFEPGGGPVPSEPVDGPAPGLPTSITGPTEGDTDRSSTSLRRTDSGRARRDALTTSTHRTASPAREPARSATAPSRDPDGTATPAPTRPVEVARPVAEPGPPLPSDERADRPAVPVIARPHPTPVTAERTDRPPTTSASSRRGVGGEPQGNESGETISIHIGRLDVRANLEVAPTPAQTGAKNEQPEGLSLEDYLAGNRARR